MDNIKCEKTKSRMSNIELLRSLSIVMIIAHHISVHSGFEFGMDSISLNRLWIQFICMGGKIGVDVFVMISGYFLVNTYSVKISKVLKLWLQIFSYSIVIYAIFLVLDIDNLSVKTLIKCLFPITFTQWWFASSYMVLYLLSPYINKLLKTLDKRTYIHMLILLTIIWSVIPTFTGQTFESNNLLWFIYLYALSGYIRLYSESKKSGIYLPIAVGLVIMNFLITVLFDIIGTKILLIGNHATFLFNANRIPIVLISLFLFLGFLNLNIQDNKIINTIATTTFGIYLIHDNEFIRPYLWKNIFHVASFQNSKFLILYTIVVMILVFTVCATIEFLRIQILEKHYMKVVNKISEKTGDVINRIFAMKIWKKISWSYVKI